MNKTRKKAFANLCLGQRVETHVHPADHEGHSSLARHGSGRRCHCAMCWDGWTEKVGGASTGSNVENLNTAGHATAAQHSLVIPQPVKCQPPPPRNSNRQFRSEVCALEDRRTVSTQTLSSSVRSGIVHNRQGRRHPGAHSQTRERPAVVCPR